MNFVAILVSAIVPMIVGFIWYSPKLFANVWMKESNLTEEDLKGANMAKILIITFVLSVMAGTAISTMVIHQNHVGSTLMAEKEFGVEGSEIMVYYKDFMTRFGDNFRTFKHGALHGAIMAIFFVLPVVGIQSLFERKSWKYIFIHVGYWFVSMIIMGGIICAWK
jgi:Protein of unknown function (DUF1761)